MDGYTIGVEIDRDDLLQMDTLTQFDVIMKAKGTATLNEARKRVNLPPVDGGNTIYLQQQDHSLAAIAARDTQLIEAAEAGPIEVPVELPAANDNVEAEARAAMLEIYKGLR